MGKPRKEQINIAEHSILKVLQDDIACYSRELFTKIASKIGSSLNIYLTGLKNIAPNLNTVKPSTLVREKLLPSSYRKYRHTFYYLKTTNKSKAKKIAMEKLLTYEKHVNLHQELGDLLETQTIAAIMKKINPQTCVHKLTNCFGVNLTKIRGKDQHIDIYVVNKGRSYGLELKNSLFLFKDWKEVYDHAKNCAVLSVKRNVKPILLTRDIEAYTKSLCKKQKVKVPPGRAWGLFIG